MTAVIVECTCFSITAVMRSVFQDSSDSGMYLFQYLVVMFQNLDLQQMGKLINPITGQLERDLQQARITIDMIQMVKDKTAGNLNEEEQRLIDQVLLDLQMNYVDEVKRAEEEPMAEAGAEGSGEAAVSTEGAAESSEATADDGQAKEKKTGANSSTSKQEEMKKTPKRSKTKRKKKDK